MARINPNISIIRITENELNALVSETPRLVFFKPKHKLLIRDTLFFFSYCSGFCHTLK